jgi:TPR repeat protein
MDYADKQYLIGIRTCAKEGDADAEKKLRESFEQAKKAAETGDAAALCDLGEHYFYGFGTAEDEAEAVKHYEKAAAAGYALAMNHLGWCYADGSGVEADEEKSRQWYKKAAFAFYDEGKNDDAFNALQGLPEDEEIHNLNRALRYDSEAEGIVSHVPPETLKFFEEMAKRLGIPEPAAKARQDRGSPPAKKPKGE